MVEKIHNEFAAFESEPVSRARTRRKPDDPDTPKEVPGRERRLIRRESGSISTLESLGFSIGDRVLINHNKKGTLRFFGRTDFQDGLWTGVELDEPTGRNNGSVGRYRYFSCRPKHGIFCPPSKLVPLRDSISPGSQQISSSMDGMVRNGSSLSEMEHHSMVRASSVASSSTASTSTAASPHLEIGANVTIAGGKKGVVKFVGEVKFKAGVWVSSTLFSLKLLSLFTEKF